MADLKALRELDARLIQIGFTPEDCARLHTLMRAAFLEPLFAPLRQSLGGGVAERGPTFALVPRDAAEHAWKWFESIKPSSGGPVFPGVETGRVRLWVHTARYLMLVQTLPPGFETVDPDQVDVPGSYCFRCDWEAMKNESLDISSGPQSADVRPN
ncbi:MAG TPA: hypothetical protein VH684_11555 [Xanthobacteraceae bacterium]|jgi:hypothetical protein